MVWVRRGKLSEDATISIFIYRTIIFIIFGIINLTRRQRNVEKKKQHVFTFFIAMFPFYCSGTL